MDSYYITPQDHDLAAQNGITNKLLTDRIRSYGWDKHKAMTQPPQKHRSFGKWPKIAQSNGIMYRVFKSRIYKLGWSLEKAATYPLQSPSEICKRVRESRRILPKELIDKASGNGISKDVLYHRIVRSGWDPERAITQPLNKAGRKQKVSA